jgi:hypothetical protein
MRTCCLILFLLGLAGCAGPKFATADGEIPRDTALIGETRVQRSLGDYEWLLFDGANQRSRPLVQKPPFVKEKNRFYSIPAGRHKILVRLQATTTRRPPLLLDHSFAFDEVELESGRAYIINGQREDDVFDVWIEDARTREHITSAVKIRPKAIGFRLW